MQRNNYHEYNQTFWCVSHPFSFPGWVLVDRAKKQARHRTPAQQKRMRNARRLVRSFTETLADAELNIRQGRPAL